MVPRRASSRSNRRRRRSSIAPPQSIRFASQYRADFRAGPNESEAGTMGGMTSWYSMQTARDWTCPPSPGDAHAFHQSLPGYSPTPLVSIPELAAELGVGRLLVKDESSRLGL